MNVELDRKDIISLLRGTTPAYSVMDKIPKELGSYVGGFLGSWQWWQWNYISDNVPYSDDYLFNLCLTCKNSK